MTSPKILPGQPPAAALTKTSRARPRLVRRGKYAQALGLSIDTDLFEHGAADGHDTSGPASPQSAHSTSSQASGDTPLTDVSTPCTASPSPPPSVSYSGDTNDETAPYFFKIAAWVRDAPLPHGESLNVDVEAIIHHSSGARVVPGPKGQSVLLVANPAELHPNQGMNDLLHFGYTRFSTRLQFDANKNKLSRWRMDGKKVALRAGTYAFVIDQDGELLASLTSSPKEGAPAGAHLNLVAGLPVLFAGELTIGEGRILSYTPMSGSYRTPPCQRDIAQHHPLLQGAQLHAPDNWQA